MDYVRYRRDGLPTTSVWLESAVKELNYRVKGTEMFWNNPPGAESILCLRAATLADNDRLTRLLKNRHGKSTLRPQKNGRSWLINTVSGAVQFQFPRAESGDPQGQYQLGVMYQNGELVPKDVRTALFWFQKAADQGYKHAIRRLKDLGSQIPSSPKCG